MFDWWYKIGDVQPSKWVDIPKNARIFQQNSISQLPQYGKCMDVAIWAGHFLGTLWPMGPISTP